MGACELHRVCEAAVVVVGTSAADKDADMTGLQGVQTVAESTLLDRLFEARSEEPSLRRAGEGVMSSYVVRCLFVRSRGQDDKLRGIDMMSRIDKLRFSVA